jgi:uncharacterized YccA/Bax inhibitor family protein
MRSGNPTLNERVFRDAAARAAEGAPVMASGLARDSSVMTLGGVANKSALALFVAIASAVLAAQWMLGPLTLAQLRDPESLGIDPASVAAVFGRAQVAAAGGAISGLVLALIISFARRTAPYLTLVYAAAEGLFLGGISLAMEAAFPGIVVQAVLLTGGVFATLLVLYRTGIVKATQNFRLMVVAATGGIMVVYLVSMVLRWFGSGIPYIHDSGPIGIGFSLFVVALAAFNLVLDFDFIEHGVESRAPKSMEWYAAFGLLVTLVWLYIEILRLLAKLRSRD